MKHQKDIINVSPSKRIYRSIIADYHLETALCELIDNSIDSWRRGGSKNKLIIKLLLDYDRQYIEVKDNAGGIQEEDISMIISPGASKTGTNDEVIGIFGVGSKRAVVALAQDIKFKTRYNNKKSLLVEIDESWLESDEWDIPIYYIDDIDKSSTFVELSRLRSKLTSKGHLEIKKALGTIYALYLKNHQIQIFLSNGKSESEISPKTFDNWSYPPGYEPVCSNGDFSIDGQKIRFNFTSGLSTSRRNYEGDDKEAFDDYGVYFYCNERLIARAVKTPEVGFQKGIAGVPHPSMALCRVIIRLKGPADKMPWNSSKTEINYRHEVFQAIREELVKLVQHSAKLSKKLQQEEGGWPQNVFCYNTGSVQHYKVDKVKDVISHLPPLPVKKRVRFQDVVQKKNAKLATEKPWAVGAYESMIAVEYILRQNFTQKNRIAFLIIDSMLEIAFKDFLVNDSGTGYSDKRLGNLNRFDLHNEVKKHTTLKPSLWKKVDHYYKYRCDLVHKRSTSTVSDSDIENFKNMSESILKALFGVRF